MITHYYRPQTLEEALSLLQLPNTQPMGGGTLLTQNKKETFSVVDLQALGLDFLGATGNHLEIGATVRLQTLLDADYSCQAMKKALQLEAPFNMRNQGTVAGTLVACDGLSTFGTVMLALDAGFFVRDGGQFTMNFGDLLPLRNSLLAGKLITKLVIPLNSRLAFQAVSRTPLDKPIVCAALNYWPSGRTRLALGGWGQSPILALDGNEPGGLEEAARNACAEAADDWASAEYRMEISSILAKRCWEEISS